MSARALSRNIHVSPKKLRLYADSVRGRNLKNAVRWLQTHGIKRTVPLTKTLVSAYHNACQSDTSISDMGQLKIKEIRVDNGSITKYFKPGSMGRVSPQRKRLSHLLVVVEKC